jgi:hypothetical protein
MERGVGGSAMLARQSVLGLPDELAQSRRIYLVVVPGFVLQLDQGNPLRGDGDHRVPAPREHRNRSGDRRGGKTR